MNEEWRPIVGWSGLYEISSAGRVRSLRRGIILKDSPTRGGYRQVTLSRGALKVNAPIHKAVARAFIGPRPAGMEVCHGNGVNTDNRIENLRYDTHRANHLDAVAHGQSPRHKLSERDVAEIRESVETNSALARVFGVSRAAIRKVRSGELHPEKEREGREPQQE